MTRAAGIKAVIVLTSLALLAVVAWNQLQPAASSYGAAFTHASGLKVGDDVRIAGIPSGSVTDIELKGATAVVRFDVDQGVTLHRDARAAVKMASLLGQNYLEVEAGRGTTLAAGTTIPVARTTPAYTVSQVVARANDTLDALDMDAIDAMITTLATELDNDPQITDRALTSVTALSKVIGDKDQQIDRLLTHTRQVTGVVRAQQEQLDDLLVDADVVATMVQRRRDTIRSLLTRGQQVVRDLDSLADRNDDQVRTMLKDFRKTLRTLDSRADDLDATLLGLAPLARYFANATGNGPWLEVGAPYFLLPDNLVCVFARPSECLG
ncbi:hypothetical protein C6I20_01455 [Aeromicrobium sp. A1-2]|uniref:MCE family protein n=1 Tax=Aeromicrobium sp. A1-2 TaxID=2107713 RepID=UPI000E508F2C|nr:MCE family protein [Aeromicrobium sp. A1-2]AXT83986.1 hypothetical protein C6I20_01455 [Aeromicrobium sp. A1-2]